MKVLITGAAGFIGRYVAAEFSMAGHEVSAFDVARPADPSLTWVRGDFTQLDDIVAATEGMDAVCHVGAIGDVNLAFVDPPLAAAVNVTGTANVLEAATQAGVKRLVYASTWEVYGPPQYQPVDEAHPCAPDHPYNITKLSGDLLAQSYRELKGLDTVCLRLGTAYGVGMRDTAVLPAFIRRASRGRPVTLFGSGEQFRQFTHASDIARGFRLAAENEQPEPIYNLVAHEQISIAQVAEFVGRHIPIEIDRQPPRVGDVSPAVISSAAAEHDLGWHAEVEFANGAEELLTVYALDRQG